MFKFFDVDCDKCLSKSEWLKGLKQLGITAFTNNILLELYDDYDVKRDGRLDFDEFGQIFETADLTCGKKPLMSNRRGNNHNE
jgi:Ca2+-binding EF-hand superfamily protein